MLSYVILDVLAGVLPVEGLDMCGLENDEGERVDLHGISQACERELDQGLG